ncbi:MAG: DUF7005 family protein [Oscillospiraceae bacterium]
MENINGKSVLPLLSEMYPQLYLSPENGGQEQYAAVVRQGQPPLKKDLSHFTMDEEDSLIIENTPAGKVCVITLNNRKDFETFYTIMGCRCVPTEISRTMGASILNGVINRGRIEQHREAFFKKELDEGRIPDWISEFKRFTSDKANYLDTLILLSTGDYSNIPGEQFGYEEKEWRELSHAIRKAHECTHFICRKKFPEQKEPVWDEICADAIGIISALGRFNVNMEEVFLGVNEQGYSGGRLENYADAETLDSLSVKIHKVLIKIDELYSSNADIEPFEFAICYDTIDR